MNLIPLRLMPGADLRSEIDAAVRQHGIDAGFVVCGIDSLRRAAVRYAGEEAASVLDGPFEILSLHGTLARDGCHVHIAIADRNGKVRGGHAAPGCIVYTTAEILVAAVAGVRFTREFDVATGCRELVIRPLGEPPP